MKVLYENRLLYKNFIKTAKNSNPAQAHVIRSIFLLNEHTGMLTKVK